MDSFRGGCGLFFFFQAEDGIRDLTVTGVQTCALPIWRGRCPDPGRYLPGEALHGGPAAQQGTRADREPLALLPAVLRLLVACCSASPPAMRSVLLNFAELKGFALPARC